MTTENDKVEMWYISEETAKQRILLDLEKMQNNLSDLATLHREGNGFWIFTEDPTFSEDLRTYMQVNYPGWKSEWKHLNEI